MAHLMMARCRKVLSKLMIINSSLYYQLRRKVMFRRRKVIKVCRLKNWLISNLRNTVNLKVVPLLLHQVKLFQIKFKMRIPTKTKIFQLKENPWKMEMVDLQLTSIRLRAMEHCYNQPRPGLVYSIGIRSITQWVIQWILLIWRTNIKWVDLL